MGLYVEFSFEDLGFPEEAEGEVDGEIITEMVDYGPACKVFVETFLEVAKMLVPVDTGFLRSTISADTDGESWCYAEATAEYAQYVEYGTTYMGAQPYFTPALEEAIAAAAEVAQIQFDMAQSFVDEQVEMILMSMMNASMAAAGGGASFGSFFGGLAMFAGIGFLAFPFLVNLYGIIDTIAQPLMGSSKSSRMSDGLYGGFLPEIQIID